MSLPTLARLTFVAVCAALAAHSARAQDADDFFRGKQLSIFIGSTAGGGYDAYARLLARHIGAHLPGNPTVVPKNMPGGGGLAVANYLYNKAPRDGTEIGIVQNGVPFERLFQTLSPGGKSAQFDAEKFGWIGSMTQTVFVAVTWHDAPVKTIEDARKTQVIFGASAPSSDSSILAEMSNNLLGTKFKIVHGYDGAAAVDLAMENGEIQGEAGKDWTTLTSTRPQWIADHKINILVQMGLTPHPALKGVPMALDLARTPQDRRIMELVFAKYGMSRPFMAPPGLPAERLALLRRAFADAMRDPALLDEARQIGAEIRPVNGEDVEKLVTQILATPADLAAKARAALQPH
jgi:tripartite-type tricarboxylate transporter receptor subunit TctC